jgi:hypothetical protein
MRISHLLALPLALSFAAVAAAQSSPQSMAPVTPNLPVQSHLLQLAPNTSAQSPTLYLQLPSGVVSNARPLNFFPASGPTQAGRTLIQLSPSAQPSAAGTAPSIEARTQAELLEKLRGKVEALKLHPELLIPERCYAIRDYTFSRDDPHSDALRLKSYTACEPSTEARLLHTGRGAARP